MKKFLFTTLLWFLSVPTYSQSQNSVYSEIKKLKVISHKKIVQISTYENDTLIEQFEAFLKFEPSRTFFAHKRTYKIIRHGTTKEIKENGDYSVIEYCYGKLLSEKCYLKNGTEITPQEFLNRHPVDYYYINPCTEYYCNHKVYIRIII